MPRQMILTICLIAAPVIAAAENMSFDVKLLGARIGVLHIGADQSGGGYSARSTFSTAGIVGAVKTMDADVTVQGSMQGAKMQPAIYNEAIDDGTRVTDVKVQFSPGTPKLLSGDTGSSAPPATPGEVKNAIDPLTGLVALLQDQPREGACNFKADIYDGHRLARIILTKSTAKGDKLICDGSYQRVSGYTPNEKKDRKVPISVEYVPNGDELRAQIVRVKTRYGAAVVKRK